MAFIIIYITFPDVDTAKRMTSQLIKQKLIACANIFPMQSSYWWQGKVANEGEFVSIVKTKSSNWDKVKKAVKKIHPYEVPCIMKLEVEANKEYEDWIEGSVD